MELRPGERMALTILCSQIDRGVDIGKNTSVVAIVALERCRAELDGDEPRVTLEGD